jgi:hypothetical protein
MEQSKIARDRRRLAAYNKDPDDYDSRSNEKAITLCLSRGSFFIQKGQHHLDDALLEFRRILFLDPTNERARKNLERIRKQLGDQNQTVTLDASEIPTPPGSPAAPRPPRTARRRPRPHRRVPTWMYVAGVAGVSALVAAVVWNASRSGDASSLFERFEPPAPSSMAETPVLLTEAAARPAADSIAAGPPVREPAVVDTAAARPAQEPPAPVVTAAASRDAARSEPAPAKREAQSEPERKPESVAEKAKLPAPVLRPAEPAGHGTLSVFFLGGVGEVTVNGRPFEHQPPFEGVILPAGRYRVACRMSGDEKPKEILVTIMRDRETVIEYELGGAPAASFGD